MLDGVRFANEVLEAHADAFAAYHRLLVDWNERVNLTAITERDEVYTKHFRDSLLGASLPEWATCAEAGAAILDVGTGAGFPGIPLALAFPDLQFVLADSLRKRLTFLHEVVESLHLHNVELVHGRAEDLARKDGMRNAFDVVVSRAVARLNVLAELTMPFLRVGGMVLAYKGPGVDSELEDGKRAAKRLGGDVERVSELDLPESFGRRTVVVLRQKALTPKSFPRKAGTPQAKPL